MCNASQMRLLNLVFWLLIQQNGRIARGLRVSVSRGGVTVAGPVTSLRPADRFGNATAINNKRSVLEDEEDEDDEAPPPSIARRATVEARQNGTVARGEGGTEGNGGSEKGFATFLRHLDSGYELRYWMLILFGGGCFGLGVLFWWGVQAVKRRGASDDTTGSTL